MRNGRSLILLSSLVGLTSLACADPKAGGPVAGAPMGSAGIALILPGAGTLNTVSYQIAGPAAFTKSGTIDVSHSSTIAAVISPLPAGTGYTIALTGTTADGATTCGGSGTFDVVAQATSNVTVHVDCHGTATSGSVLVNGAINLCPVVDGLSASPGEVFVGSSLALTGAAHDLDGGPSPLSYLWSAPSGTFSSATAANPTFTCTTGGPVMLRLAVSDGDPSTTCAATATVTVSCTSTPLQADVKNIVVIYAEKG